MKFTNGYWLLRPEITAHYAVEYYDSICRNKALTVFAPSKPVRSRGDQLNQAMLTITFGSPMPDVLKITLVHHDGAVDLQPVFALNSQDDVPVELYEDEQTVSLRSGNLQAVISKKPNAWSVSYRGGGREITNSGFHNMAYMVNNKTGRHDMTEQLFLDVGACVYGFGERFTAFVKNGQVIDIWNEDGGTASEISYKNLPFYITNRGYGVFIDSPADISFEVASEKVERVCFSEEGERLTYYLIYGPHPRDILRKYTALTGRPALPPAWSFGLWLSTSFTTQYDEATVMSFIQGMADRHIPLRVFHFDCFWMKGFQWCDLLWDPATFPDPAGLIRRLHERGLKVNVWINPYIAQKSVLFTEGKAGSFLVRKTDGSIWQTDLWQAGMALVDFTNPAACVWYENKLQALLDSGVDAFKTDFGERIPVRDIVWHDGSDPVRMHNYYTYLYNQTVFRLLEHHYGQGEAVVFARSATVGSQQFPVHWGGDCTASYESMAETLRGGLSLALGGFGFWSHDIGGFEMTASADIYKRWCAFGLLSSHSRLHGSESYRVPWLFDDEATDVLRRFSILKNRLMPYLYRQAVLAHTEGIPVLRPMMLEFPDDPAADTLDRQYLFGESLLVAPVFRADGQVDYYLPAGTWTSLLDGSLREGGCWRRETYDVFSLPLLVRPNTVLPLGSRDDLPDYDYCEDLTLALYAIADGAEITTVIPDTRGRDSLVAVTRRAGEQITIQLSRPIGVWTVQIDGKELPQMGSTASITR
ncbi:MAG: alpha-xylosidase [Clostridiaceae bacterium]|nr:alpha-xylosidase [Clostridiaceae bacterium]